MTQTNQVSRKITPIKAAHGVHADKLIYLHLTVPSTNDSLIQAYQISGITCNY